MSRYMERAENVARIIEVNSYLTLDMPGEELGQWRPLITISADDDAFDARYPEANQENVIRFLAFDRENPNSIISCLNAARENARIVRSRITSELWEQINKMYLFVNQAAAQPDVLESPSTFYTRLKMSALLFQGIMESTLTHDEEWHFCRLGRMLERADKTSRLLDVKYFLLLPDIEYVGSSVDDIQWAAVLRSASALEMYRREYGIILPNNVVEFLLLNRQFPRSVMHCLYRAEESLRVIASPSDGLAQTLPERRLGQLRSDLTYRQANEIIAGGLHEFLDHFQLRLNMVGAAIYDTFFAVHPAP
jgi:uncharacterized alpha-E superfamily protein